MQHIEEPKGISRTSFFTRLVTAAVFAAIVVVAIVLAGIVPLGWLGMVILGVVVGALSGLASKEFYRIAACSECRPRVALGVTAAALMPLAAALLGLPGLSGVLVVFLAIVFTLHVLDLDSRLIGVAVDVFGVLYVGGLLSFLVLIVRDFDAGGLLGLAFVFSCWANDVLAYLVGSTIGRHKLAPHISPAKSWEGLIASVLGPLLVWVGVALAFPDASIPVWLAIVLALVTSASCFVGDLFESRLKREVGVKDSGSALPGHGGWLDRLDAVIFTAPIVYWLLVLGGLR
ncbi:MAG: phosphatidate cytidylyltransferase [Coriobacteriia bacterium]